jgi:NADPH:quinone reductase
MIVDVTFELESFMFTSPTESRRAVAFDRFGSSEVLRVLDLPVPQPGEGEVLIRVAAATINPTDVLMMEGAHAALMRELSPPFIAGMEFFGHIEQLGAGVSGLRTAQPVMGIVNPRRPQGGAHAQMVCLPAASVAPLTGYADAAEVAAVPMNGLTARMCLDWLDLPVGASLLVTGAVGAVGGFVIQLARQAGLQVVADAKESDHELVLHLGAHMLVPRGEGLAAAVHARFPAGVDGVVDTALLGNTAADQVRSGGAMVSLRRGQAIGRSDLRHTHVSVLQQATNTEALRWLAERFQDGTLVPRVARRMPITQAAQAFNLVRQGGLRGRVVLDFSEESSPV